MKQFKRGRTEAVRCDVYGVCISHVGVVCNFILLGRRLARFIRHFTRFALAPFTRNKLSSHL